MSGELVARLRARLDEQEAAIIRYRDEHPGEPCTNSLVYDPDGQDYDPYDSCARHIEVAEATPYRDAAFGLADIAAKRQILDLWGQVDTGRSLHAEGESRAWLLDDVVAALGVAILGVGIADTARSDPDRWHN